MQRWIGVPQFYGHLHLVLIGLLLLVFTPQAAPATAAIAPSPQIEWRDTGLVIPGRYYRLCFDASQPDSLLVDEVEIGTVAYNWEAGQRTVISNHHLTEVGRSSYYALYSCGTYGLFFDRDPNDTVWRFSASDPVGQIIAHAPTHTALDGTAQMYALETEWIDGRRIGQLWASADGGLTWIERSTQFDGKIESIAVAQSDGRALYAAVVERPPRVGPPSAEGDPGYLDYAIYFSPDAGNTWEQRFTGRAEGITVFGGPRVEVYPVAGSTSQVDTVMLVTDYGSPGSSNRWWYSVSSDGARAFHEVGMGGMGGGPTVVQTEAGLVKLYTYRSSGYELSRSTDGGATWQPLAGPPQDAEAYIFYFASLHVVRTAPANLFLYDGNRHWYSPDSGATWQPIAAVDSHEIYISPFLPLTVLRVQDGHIQRLDLPVSGEQPPVPPPPGPSPDAITFPATGHTLRGGFKQYWEDHGGLPIFGYPISDVFIEERPEDGRTYTVQYFERSRFEYHPYQPEDNSIPFGVMLGRLGDQITAARQAAGEEPFTRVTAPDDPCVTYFPETGHTLRAGFKQYWEEHGGLEIFGYPISEEFVEVNPDDGQLSTVQYFERSRFEYHPEHRGTPGEVLLTRLGNMVLKDRDIVQ